MSEQAKRQERCETCRFWDSDTDVEGDDRGECRRFPPVLIQASLDKSDRWAESYHRQFPGTDSFDWCGEWQPTAAAAPATDTPPEPHR